ncbi:MAG TPA: sigma-70 family RNA polymerase sigma factor [Kofleriaceae bacterium]|nr:sigma-70 family RNA polymerase sigma factor [Kofleriaceae bacterium]
MAGTPDAVLRELEGLRALARALVGSDVDADDLLQDTAVDAIRHPPRDDGRPTRPWLAAVLRNRSRMDLRAASRRRRREQAVAETASDASAGDSIDRARVLERLSRALVELDEPFRTTVVRRYLDGQSSAEIARALAVPPGTVRWRLKTGLDRLRAALDDHSPSWRAALIPCLQGAFVVKTKLSVVVIVLALLLAGAWWKLSRPSPAATKLAPAAATVAAKPSRAVALAPGQARATAETVALPGGRIAGRVINWSTSAGVADADVTFTSAAGATTVKTGDGGAFELAPNEPGAYSLATINAAGFLPYAPELDHSPIDVQFRKGRTVDGIIVFLYPALDYHGVVVDRANAPVAGAHVALLGSPAGEQAEGRLATEWTTAADGSFTFHAPDDTVFEASKGALRGWAKLDGNVAITKLMTIQLGDAPARDSTITGAVVDEHDQPLPDALVRAEPAEKTTTAPIRATAFATTGPDGKFALDHLDKSAYDVAAELDGRARTTQRVNAGTRGVELVLTSGVTLAGTVATGDGTPVPSFTLTALRRDGAARDVELARTIVDPRGYFEVQVSPGDFDLVAAATGLAPTAPLHVDARESKRDLQLVAKPGATITGKVVDSATGQPLQYARVMRDAFGAGASAQPSNVGTVTREDGTFELAGVPEGLASINVAAGDYHRKSQSGLVAKDGATLGPLSIALVKLMPGEQPTLELVGIGIAMAADGDGLRVQRVIPNGGAQAAGIIVGDLVIAVDGTPASELGVEGAVAHIRGDEGTTVSLSIRRGDQVLAVVCTRMKLKA